MTNTRMLMTVTAVVLGSAGLLCLFLPAELAGFYGLAAPAEVPIQLVGAGLLSMACLDWMGRSAVYGGIYGRPIVVANLAFGAISAGSLASAVLEGMLDARGWIPAALMLMHMLAFGSLMWRPPWSANPGETSSE